MILTPNTGVWDEVSVLLSQQLQRGPQVTNFGMHECVPNSHPKCSRLEPSDISQGVSNLLNDTTTASLISGVRLSHLLKDSNELKALRGAQNLRLLRIVCCYCHSSALYNHQVLIP